ncbi:nucleotidyltransferase family protein [Peribacillus sp. NPDC097264]|uniref:nucleotidyltransferase family protein n=1 Tax=Peribacillus sp. NPDC097264 TaxID=3390616 RepID=UPI003D023F77
MNPTLLQILYDSNIELPNDSAYYWGLLDDIEKSYVHAQTYTIMKQGGRLEATPAFYQQILKEKFQRVLFQNILIKNQTNQILNGFEKSGIDIIPLKGTAFAEQHFGHLGSRPTSDIDLLIKPTDMDRAIDIVKSLGYIEERKPIPFHFHRSYSKVLPGSSIPLTVELHWDILKQTTANFCVEEIWEEALSINDSFYIKQLSEFHLFYMICLHGWRHNMESLKYFIDIIQLISTLNIDYVRLLEDTKRHKTKKRIIRTLSIVYQQLPTLHLLNKFPNEIPTSYGHRNSSLKKYVDFIDYSFLSYDSPKHSMVELYHWLHPKY